MKLSIIIPHYNDCTNVNALIDSIINSEEFDFNDYQIIVVDDYSLDVNKEFIYKRNIEYIELSKNYGPAYARNYGAKLAKNEWLLFLDSDTRIIKSSLKLIKKYIYDNQDISIINGICHYNPINISLGSVYKGIVEYNWHLDIIKKNIQPEIFNSRVGIIKASIFESIGGFNKDIKGALLEEHEFSYRIPKKNKIVLVMDLMVMHDFPGIFGTTKVYFWRTIKWVELFLTNKKFDNKSAVAGTSIANALGHLVGALLIFISPLLFIAGKEIIYIELLLLSIFIIIYRKLFEFSLRLSFFKFILVFTLHLYFSIVIICSAILGFLYSNLARR